MSLQLRKILELPKNLYQEGSPIVVTTSFLSVESSNGNGFVELNVKNISSKTVASACVEIISRCSKDSQETDSTVHNYLNLHCKRNEEFGKGVNILLPNNLTRDFSFRFTRIVFDDESVYEFKKAEFESIPATQTLKSRYDDYQLMGYAELNGKCLYVPFVYKDLRICTCGEFMSKEENTCPNCGGDFLSMYNADPDSMKKKGIYSAADKLLKSAEQISLINIENYDSDFANAFWPIFNKNKTLKFYTEDIEKKTSIYEESLKLFESISGWKDSEEKADLCRKNIQSLKLCLDNRKKQTQKAINEFKKKLLKVSGIAISVIIVLAVVITVNNSYIKPMTLYNQAIDAAENKSYEEAYEIFENLGWFKDSREQYNKLKNSEAQEYLDKGEYDKGYDILEEIGNFGAIKENKIQRAAELLKAQKYDEAYSLLEECENYEPAIKALKKSKYERGKAYLAAGDFEQGYNLLSEASGYKDSDDILNENKYVRACEYLKEEKFDEAYELFEQITTYKDSKDILTKSYYDRGVAYLKANDYDNAYSFLKKCIDYADSEKLINESYYKRANAAVEKEKFSEAISLYKQVDLKYFPDVAEKISTAEKLLNIKSKYDNGYYKVALSLCNQMKGNKNADKYAERCRNKISIIESYCGVFEGEWYYGDDEEHSKHIEITVTYNYDTKKMIFRASDEIQYKVRSGEVDFDPDNPNKKLPMSRQKRLDSFYYQFDGPNVLHFQSSSYRSLETYLRKK